MVLKFPFDSEHTASRGFSFFFKTQGRHIVSSSRATTCSFSTGTRNYVNVLIGTVLRPKETNQIASSWKGENEVCSFDTDRQESTNGSIALVFFGLGKKSETKFQFCNIPFLLVHSSAWAKLFTNVMERFVDLRCLIGEEHNFVSFTLVWSCIPSEDSMLRTKAYFHVPNFYSRL